MGIISILLADDSITIQKVVGIIFASDGYTLTVVDNGKSVLPKAREVQPDVILVDAIMPDMSGYDVCSEIRKDPDLAGKPLLLLTGSFEPFDEQKARDSGADDHIVKPFESQQLVAKVKELYELAKQRPSVSAAAAPEPEGPEIAVQPEPFVPEPVSPSVVEPAVSEETISFDEKAPEPQQIEISPDDPWGAYSTTLPEPDPADLFSSPQPEKTEEPEETASFEPDVMEIISQEPASFEIQQPAEPVTGASWTPVEEQTFEFREEIVDAPAAIVAEAAAESVIPEPESAFNADAFEPMAAVEPVSEKVAEVPQYVTPVAAVAPVALTDEQVKELLLSASKETIERIVWEVVPDLAETMIKEAIRRITEGK